MAQVAEITFGQKVMEKETEKRISEIEGEQARNPCPSFLRPRHAAGPGRPFLCPAFSVLRRHGFFGTSLVLCALIQVLGRCRPVWD